MSMQPGQVPGMTSAELDTRLDERLGRVGTLIRQLQGLGPDVVGLHPGGTVAASTGFGTWVVDLPRDMGAYAVQLTVRDFGNAGRVTLSAVHVSGTRFEIWGFNHNSVAASFQVAYFVRRIA